MSELRFSVVIPTRHRNESLAVCLERLAPGKQTLPADRYEVIVTDDGSESTAEQFIATRFPWARWTAGPRKGPAANRNHGVTLTQGQFIAFTDDDCVPDLDWLKSFEAALTPEVLVYEGKTTCNAGVHSPMMQAPVNETGGCLWSCNMLMQRSVANQFPFDEGFPYPHMEDSYLREQLKLAGQRFVFVPKAIVDHPPRPVLPGVRRAAALECEVIFHYKLNEEPLTRSAFLWRMFKIQIKTLFRHPLGVATLAAAYHSSIELFYVSIHYNQWKRRHAPIR